jgi:prephenate dehydratase
MHVASPGRISYLGPEGTFTEEALLDYLGSHTAEIAARPTIEDVLSDVAVGAARFGFVPIENSIEGTVFPTLDALIFRFRLLIAGEWNLPIRQQLIGAPGAELAEVTEVLSYQHALGQVSRFLREKLPHATLTPTNSTAEAVQLVASQGSRALAAIGPRRAADLYELAVLAADIDDRVDNTTRFLLVNRDAIPMPTGNDRTSIVCFQVEDRPGSLLAILAELASRGLNLTKLESRPAKTGMGVYCFAIDLEGHVADAPVQESISNLNRFLAQVKFLGSYPVASARARSVAPEVATDPLVKELLERIDPSLEIFDRGLRHPSS